MFLLPDEIDSINQKTIGVRTIFPFSLLLVFSFLDAPAQEAKDSGEDFKKEFGHQLTSGKRLHVNLAGTSLIIDFYALVSGDAKSQIISFQDTIKDNGDSSDEFNAGFQMINSSIKFL